MGSSYSDDRGGGVGVRGVVDPRDGVRASENLGCSALCPGPYPVGLDSRPWETSGLGLAEAPLFICTSPDVN